MAELVQKPADEKKNEFLLEFSNELTIRNVADNASALKSAFLRVNSIKIRHTAVHSFDISYIQLLLSAEKAARQEGKQLFLDGEQPEEFRQLLKDSGCTTLPAMQKLLNNGK